MFLRLFIVAAIAVFSMIVASPTDGEPQQILAPEQTPAPQPSQTRFELAEDLYEDVYAHHSLYPCSGDRSEIAIPRICNNILLFHYDAYDTWKAEMQTNFWDSPHLDKIITALHAPFHEHDFEMVDLLCDGMAPFDEPRKLSQIASWNKTQSELEAKMTEFYATEGFPKDGYHGQWQPVADHFVEEFKHEFFGHHRKVAEEDLAICKSIIKQKTEADDDLGTHLQERRAERFNSLIRDLVELSLRSCNEGERELAEALLAGVQKLVRDEDALNGMCLLNGHTDSSLVFKLQDTDDGKCEVAIRKRSEEEYLGEVCDARSMMMSYSLVWVKGQKIW